MSPDKGPPDLCPRTTTSVPQLRRRSPGVLPVGRILIVNPLVPTPMDAVAALMGLAITLLVLAVLVASAVRVTRRRREPPGTSTTEVSG